MLFPHADISNAESSVDGVAEAEEYQYKIIRSLTVTLL